MANYMKEVAKLLGLEIEETFRIKGEEPYFRFTKEDFELSTDLIEWTKIPSVHLRCILTGEVTIIKNWKPRNGEFYFSPSPTRKSLRECLLWGGSENDNYRLNHGFVFRTPDEAVGAAKKMLVATKEIVMSKDLCNESTKAIRLKNIQSIFGFFAEQIMNKERWETEPANLAAYTAVDVLIDYCLSRDKYCQDCVFNHEANMCELFSRIRQRTNKEMM